jgi:hypothetical protein
MDSKIWDFLSKNESSYHFSVDCHGTLGVFQGSELFQLTNHQIQQQSRAPHSVLAAGDLKKKGISYFPCTYISLHHFEPA